MDIYVATTTVKNTEHDVIGAYTTLDKAKAAVMDTLPTDEDFDPNPYWIAFENGSEGWEIETSDGYVGSVFKVPLRD